MASTSNDLCGQTSAVLNQEIKDLKSKCIETCTNIFNNIPVEMQSLTADNLEEKSLCYVDGLRADILSADTAITSDSNLLTSQFLNDINDQVSQMEELVAYHRGLIQDVDAKITRFKDLIKIGEESHSTRSDKLDVRPEHVQMAKQRFQILKKEFYGLIYSLLPNVAEEMVDLLACLMQEKLQPESGGYVKITTEQFRLASMLEDISIVVQNPYDRTLIKLAY